MLDTAKLLEIISGRRRGLVAVSLRCLLGALTPVYRAVVAIRNWVYDRQELRLERDGVSSWISRVTVPVISVGNLTTGGTGKTPMVIWIAKLLRGRNLRVAIISRGYGAQAEPEQGGWAGNDEAMEMERRLPDVPQLQDADRIRMANIAIEELDSQVLLLDDGFQHRRLDRALDIVLIDATNPFGYERLLPRGLLREPLSSLRRADIVVISRCDQVPHTMLEEMQARVKQHNAQATIVQTRIAPQNWLQYDGQHCGLKSLDGKQVVAFCGVGNPDGFRATLENFALELVDFCVFPDHHSYSREDLDELGTRSASSGASAIVCTHKDLVKVGCNQLAGIPVYALLIDLEFVDGQPEFETALLGALSGSRLELASGGLSS